MFFRLRLRLCLLVFFSFSQIASAQTLNTPPPSPSISLKSFHQVIPLEFSNDKLFIHAQINGQNFRFIWDTGSPTVISKKAADTIGLQRQGSNVGRDGNGAAVQMSKSTLDSLKLGELEFNNVPVMIFDPSDLVVASCVLDSGVIGSEILSLANWQINTRDSTMIISSAANTLEYIKAAKSAPLLSYGYPFTPIVEYRYGKLKDKAMFDTGAPTVFSLNNAAYAELLKQRQIENLEYLGRGYGGESAGGIGNIVQLHKTRLTKLKIGKYNFPEFESWTREQAPSLLGAKILDSHIVTLDYDKNKVHFYSYAPMNSVVETSPIRFHLVGDRVRLSFIDSHYGEKIPDLALDQVIDSLNGRPLKSINENNKCDTVAFLQKQNTQRNNRFSYQQDGAVKMIALGTDCPKTGIAHCTSIP